MRRVRFRDPAGTVRVGDWQAETITTAGRTYDPADVELLAPVDPTKVLGIGPNYRGQLQEGMDEAHQRLWWKGARNVVAGPNDTVTLPESSHVIYEGELGVVIGEQCRNITPEQADDVIAGYTCVDDISNQDATDEETFFRRKTFDNAAPMGPVVVSPDRVPDDPRIRLWLNDELRQDTADDEMLFTPQEVIAEASQWVTLEPEDVIMLGTTTGLGALSDGDRVRIEIEGIGTLEHDVAEP